MVSPVLEEGATQKVIYFPKARWFSYHDGFEVSGRGNLIAADAPLDFINLHLRGGLIYPTQEPAMNTELSRQNPFGLIVALDEEDKAAGSMYYDDGDVLGKLFIHNFPLHKKCPHLPLCPLFFIFKA